MVVVSVVEEFHDEVGQLFGGVDFDEDPDRRAVTASRVEADVEDRFAVNEFRPDCRSVVADRNGDSASGDFPS